MYNSTLFYFIINPMGGGGKSARSWERLKEELKNQNIPYDFKITTRKGEGTEYAVDAINNGFKHLIAVGGDGSAHEVANGILQMQSINAELDISMSLFSCGTGNDWVKAHKIPRNATEFVKRLKSLCYKIQDVGLVDYHVEAKVQSCYMINVAGLAYDAFVAKKCENRKQGYWAGKFYLFYVFKLLFQYKPEKAFFNVDGKTWKDRVYTINVGKCPYSGGNMQLVPHAVPDDGKLAITIASSLPKWEVIRQTPKFYNGKIGTHPRIKTMHAYSIEIKSLEDKEILLEVDGEYLGNTPVKITVVEKALKIFGVT